MSAAKKDPIKLGHIWREIIAKDGKFGTDKDPSKSLGYPPDKLVRAYFRQWRPIKEKNEGKRHLAFDESGKKIDSFDAYSDSWFDYPTIIQSKMGGLSWQNYNCLIALHVPACTLECWHCYVTDDSKNAQEMFRKGAIEYVTPADVVDAFLEQKKVNEENNGEKVPTNVIRVTGGEPLLAPDLILGFLEELDKRGLSKEIFVWTETNLTPFLKDPASDRPMVESWVDLKKLAEHRNFAVHPCLHGICATNFSWITGCDPYYFEGILEALKTLIDFKFDIYPTFGSDVSPPDMVPYIFRRLKDIRANLPQKFALIDFELTYPPTKKRIVETLKPEEIYNKVAVVSAWNNLIKHDYGEDYPCQPRHLVSL